MEIPIELQLDPSGFLRRECPSCNRQFKWFYGETEGRPSDFVEPENYTCPYCGIPADHDSWWTTEQLEYAQSAAMGPIMRNLKAEFGRSFKINTSHQAPTPLIDPDDMIIVEPPCHPFEPLKIAENWTENLHCMMCGAKFRV